MPFVLCFMAQDVGFLGISHGFLLGKAREISGLEEGGDVGPSKLEGSYEPGTPNNQLIYGGFKYFQFSFLFGGNDPIWLIVLRWVETTN